MDGLEATQRIKGDPRGKETAIVVLTASAMDDDRKIAVQSGADDFLPKPCREDELFEKIGGLLDVAYDYDDEGGAENQEVAGRAGVAPSNAATLKQLPRELIEELRKATLTGNKKRLDNLIVKVRATDDEGSALALQTLADGYQYDALTRLLEEACQP
jgi:CheY-like chemotaxis protein